jgi:hypothetical protein
VTGPQTNAVAALAARIGVKYSAREKCELGAPFYAFTEDELAKFAAALTAAPRDWQDIATAPTDGTRILGYSPDYGQRETYMRQYGEGSMGYAEWKAGKGPLNCGWDWSEPVHNWGSSWKPTHWKPLAAAPLPREGGECAHERSHAAPWRCAKCGHRFDAAPVAAGEWGAVPRWDDGGEAGMQEYGTNEWGAGEYVKYADHLRTLSAAPAPPVGGEVGRLVAKWREQADDVAGIGSKYQRGTIARERADIGAQVLRQNAVDLEAALSAPAAPVAGDAVLAPHYRGYAKLGIGAYLLNHSAEGQPAELAISLATEAEKSGRVVGDERDNEPGAEMPAERMAVRLEFASVAGLDALEQQLRHLRRVHFPDSATPPNGGEPLTALAADFRDSGKYAGYSVEERLVYHECAERLERVALAAPAPVATCRHMRTMEQVCDPCARYPAPVAEDNDLHAQIEDLERELDDARETCAEGYERDCGAALRGLMKLVGHEWEEALTASEQADVIAEHINNLSAAPAARPSGDLLANLYAAASKGFHTSTTFGPDKLYHHTSRFESLADLQDYAAAWTKAMVSVRDGKPSGARPITAPASPPGVSWTYDEVRAYMDTHKHNVPVGTVLQDGRVWTGESWDRRPAASEGGADV